MSGCVFLNAVQIPYPRVGCAHQKIESSSDLITLPLIPSHQGRGDCWTGCLSPPARATAFRGSSIFHSFYDSDVLVHQGRRGKPRHYKKIKLFKVNLNLAFRGCVHRKSAISSVNGGRSPPYGTMALFSCLEGSNRSHKDTPDL